jgi:predicted nucleotidyltransferase
MGTFNLDEHKPALEAYFAALNDVVLAYLFGSHARGQAGPLSDIDVAVLLAGQPDDSRCFDMRLEIIGGLMDILRADDMDVAILNQTPLALRYRVLRDGVLLFCRDHQAMIEFKTRTVIERHEHAILERARKGELLHGHNPHRGTLEYYRRLRERLKGTATPDRSA